MKARVPARRTVLTIRLEWQEGDATITPPKLLLVTPARPRGNVSEMNLSITDQLLLLQLVYENESYGTQGKEAAEVFMGQFLYTGSERLGGEGDSMFITTQDHKNVDLMPAVASLDIETSNLVHAANSSLFCSLISDESLRLSCPAYGQPTTSARDQDSSLD